MIRKQAQPNEFIEKFRYESYILNPAMRNLRNSDFIDGNRTSMENFVYKLNDPELGQIVNAKFELAALQKQFQIVSQARINSGRRPLTEWPSDLQEKKNLWEAKLTVHLEELDHVEAELAKINESTEVEQSKPHHRKDWGSGRMSNGQLCEIGGFAVKPNADGLLCIDDERCDFDKMEVWRFQAQIVTPIFREESHRHKVNTREAIESGRPRKAIARAKTPIWDREQDRIEYPDYSDAVLKKLEIQK